MLLLVTTVFVANADEYLVVQSANGGASQKFNVADITQISFSGNDMVVEQSSGSTTIAVTDIEQITFDLQTSAVKTVEAELSEDVTFAASNGVVTITNPTGNALNIAVYNLKGMPVYQRTGVSSDTIDFNAMSAGIYIIKANNKVIKFTR
jgi:hypothetical protein